MQDANRRAYVSKRLEVKERREYLWNSLCLVRELPWRKEASVEAYLQHFPRPVARAPRPAKLKLDTYNAFARPT